MSNKSVGTMPSETSNISSQFDSTAFNSIRETLPDRVILNACRDCGYRYRRRLISPVLTVIHMIVAAIWSEESFTASWQLLWTSFAAAFPETARRSPSRGTVSNSRKRMPLAVWQSIFAWLSRQGQERSEGIDRWRGHRVVATDGTCMSLQDTKELCSSFGLHKGYHGVHRYPLAKMVMLVLVETMIAIDYRIGRYKTDETELLKPMLKTLRKGDLLLADRHFAGSNLYWLYESEGLEYLTPAHQKLKISRLKRLWNYGENDFVAKLKIGAFYRRQNPDMPRYIKARFIQVEIRVRGKYQRVWLVTSLLDAYAYPAAEVAELYGRRWRIETMFRRFKVDMDSDLLRSKSPDAVHKEVAARICALNIVGTIMLEASIANNVDVLRISFVDAVRTIIAFAPHLAVRPPEQLPAIYRRMLVEIAARQVPYRPNRSEPRKLKFCKPHYPPLRTTRAEWRAEYAA